MTTTPPRAASDIESLVSATGRRLHRNRLCFGTVLLTATAVGLLSAGALLDMWVALPVPLRVLSLAVLLLVAGSVAALFVARPILRPASALAVASLMERAVGGMHNRLVTVLDVRRRGEEAEHAGMYERLVQQTCARLAAYRVEQVADPLPARRASLATAGILTAALALTLLLPDRFPVAVQRIVRPLAPIPPPTWVRLRVEPGDADILQGEPATIRAAADRGVVNRLALRVRRADGEWVTYPMQRESARRFAFRIEQMSESCDYQVTGGRARTPVYHLAALPRPAILRLDAEVVLPSYMGIAEPQPVEPQATQISAPCGAAIRLAARTSGNPAAGIVQWYGASTNRAIEESESLVAWFDDELPADAQISGEWRWTSDRSCSGTRSHTFGWADQPYGFRTRLQQFTVPRRGAMFVDIYLDPEAPPSMVELAFTINDTPARAAWKAAKPSPAAQRREARLDRSLAVRGVFSESLPEPGVWTRGEIEVPALLASAVRPVTNDDITFSAVRFRVDRGRAWFDRVGWVERRTQTVERVALAPLSADPMRQAASNEWVAEVPVTSDGRFALRFRNARGHENTPMQAMPVLVTADRPPSVLAEKPGRNVALAESEPVPIVARALDDYGIQAVGIRVGRGADALGPTNWFATYDTPLPVQVALTAVDPAAQKVGPGEALHYTLLTRDRKGQTAETEPYRISLAAAGSAAAPVEKSVPLRGVLDGLTKLLQYPARLAESLTQALALLPEAQRPTLQFEGTLVLMDPQGLPLSQADIKELLDTLQPLLAAGNSQSLSAMESLLREQQAQAADLARLTREAAAMAGNSALGLPYEAQMLQDMADKTRAMADAALTNRSDLAEWLAQGGLPAAGGQRPPAATWDEMQRRMQELLAAHDLLGQNPESPEDVALRMAQLRAGQALDDMSLLGGALGNQQEQMAALTRRLAELQAQAAQTPAAQMAEVRARQQQLDAQAAEMMRQARELLGDRLGVSPDEIPPAPWAPPGEGREALPVERDTPEENPPTNAPAGDGEGPMTPEKLQRLLDAQPEWWDRPVAFSRVSPYSQMSERYEGRDRPVPPAPPGPPQGADMTPRDMLQEHQQGLEQQLTEASRSVSQQWSAADLIARQLRDALSSPLSANSPPGTMQAPAFAQTLRTMASGQMEELMGMAARARLQQLGLALPRPGGTPSQGGTGAPAAALVTGVFAAPADMEPAHQATLYRLPPALRQPLLQGMQERAPEGYGKLVDSYYDRLSEEMK